MASAERAAAWSLLFRAAATSFATSSPRATAARRLASSEASAAADWRSSSWRCSKMLSLPLPNATSFSVTSFSVPPSTEAGSCASIFSTWLVVATKRSRTGSSRLGSATPAASFNRPAARLPSARRPSRTWRVFTPPSIRPVIALVLRVVTSSLVITNPNSASSTIGIRIWSNASWVTLTAVAICARFA